jgi:hypothetical protein
MKEDDPKPLNPSVSLSKPIPPHAKETGVSPQQISITALAAAVEDKFREVEKKISDVNSFMGLIIVVMFLGFITCLFAVFSMFYERWSFNINIQLDLNESVNEFSQKVDEVSGKIDVLEEKLEQPTPIPNNSPMLTPTNQ